MRTLAVETRWDGGEAILILNGELDLSTAPQVEGALADAEGKQPERMVLDLRQLAFMDSTGLRVVLAADGRARKDGRRLEVVPGPPQVHRVFRIALLDKRLTFVDPPGGDGEPGEGSS
jgi:anti-anti-sigma factor